MANEPPPEKSQIATKPSDVHALVLGLADRFRHKDSAPPSPAREAERLQKARAIDQMLKAGDGDDGLDFQ